MNKFIFTIILIICVLNFGFGVDFVQAENVNLEDDILDQITAGGAAGGLGEVKDPRAIVVYIINIFLSILGTVFMILMLMSGFWFITAHGEEEKIKKATKTIRSAIVGLIIVMLSYAITYFVSTNVLEIIR